jgi:hypothetical protein
MWVCSEMLHLYASSTRKGAPTAAYPLHGCADCLQFSTALFLRKEQGPTRPPTHLGPHDCVLYIPQPQCVDLQSETTAIGREVGHRWQHVGSCVTDPTSSEHG